MEYHPIDLSVYERKIYSQFGEDGITIALFELLGTTNQYFVEIGCKHYEGCSQIFWGAPGWKGIVIDGRELNASLPAEVLFKRVWITAENVVQTLKEIKVPENFDFLSLDIDLNNYWIWKALIPHIRPRIVCVGYNGIIPVEMSIASIYAPNDSWQGGSYAGGSLKAMYTIGRENGYSLVYTTAGVNAFFVIDEAMDSIQLKDANDYQKLFKPYPGIPANRNWIDTQTDKEVFW